MKYNNILINDEYINIIYYDTRGRSNCSNFST